jgi:hypothetical protein
MYKLLIAILIIPILVMLEVIRIDDLHARNVYFQTKYSLNHAVHAAVQQLDIDLLSEGEVDFDYAKAERFITEYLQANLKLDADLTPLSTSFLKQPIENIVIEFVDHNQSFPHILKSPSDEIEFNRPGVYVRCYIHYPRMFGLLAPITWHIQAAAQVVPLALR